MTVNTGTWLIGSLILILGTQPIPSADGKPDEQDWSMLAHDPARTGATVAEIRPPFERKWYRLFPDEGLMAGVQPIIAGGKVFVGTMGGVIHAMDSETGEDIWTFRASGPILHTCAVSDDKVFFGSADGRVYSVRASSGGIIWSVQTGSAVWNSPVVYRDTVFIGSRDGKLYAISSNSGEVRWSALTGGMILSSPAVDVKTGRIYVGSEDMHVYSFDFLNGNQVWRSDRLPGVSFRGYHPVIAPDGSVMITTAPAISLDSFNPVLLDMVKEIFGDFASWRHSKEENARLREENFRKMEEPGTYEAQLDYLRKRLTEQTAYQTLFVLNPENGEQKFVAPILYAESMNGTGAPPVVTPDGKVLVKFQALLRSRYEHYSPFMNVGYLDTASGYITPIMDQSRTYGWHDSLLLVHDEQCQLAVSGRVLINTHQDNVNAMDLDTLDGYSEPFCRNIHEPQPNEAVSIWTSLLRGDPLSVGKEWLARGTAVYGGGSAIDTPVSIAGDSFYYIPAHEINSGAAVIAYRMQPGGTASQRVDPPDSKITEDEWERIQQLPWDWDLLEMSRLKHALESLPGKIPGTRQQPLTEQAEKLVAKIADDELDRFIREVPVISLPEDRSWAALREDLCRHVRKLVSHEWRPWVFPAGKHPWEAYRFFTDPVETLYTLAQAYPYLDEDLKQTVRRYVADVTSPGGVLANPAGQSRYPPDAGRTRSAYDAPPEELMHVIDDVTRSRIASLYPFWLWAHRTDDWSIIESHWQEFRELISQEPNNMEEDCRNGYIAGLIAYCRMARHMGDDDAVEQGLTTARKAMRDRLVYELSYTRGGLITRVPHLRSIFGRWRRLTPEVGRLCAAYAGETHKRLMDVHVDHHRPTWWLAWNVETMWRNECPFEFPTMSSEVFAARAWVLREPVEQLRKYLDLPWCEADLFYIQKLVLCIEACGELSHYANSM